MEETNKADFRTVASSLAEAFAQGWSRASLDMIMSVFAPEARFIETPFSKPHEGIDTVRDYWRDVPHHQSEITCSTGEVFVAGPWFSFEFKCVFRRRRTGEWVDSRGAIFCETNGDLITEMRMYWHRWG